MMDYNNIIKRGNSRLTLGDAQLLFSSAKEISAKNIVEIGSMDGTSSMVFGELMKELKGHVYCVEPAPKTRWKVNIKEMELIDYVTLIMQASPWVDQKLIPKPIDYLFIDGDHRTRWAVVDYHYWFPYVRVGGRIAFHDFCGGKGVANWVKRAIDLIMEDDKDKIKEVGRAEGRDRGTIVFEKVEKNKGWI